MTYRLSTASLTLAIRHLCRYGDTDVFPHLPELAFLREDEVAVVSELSALDLDTFDPSGAIEALSPKSRHGFRIVHQMPLLETVLLLAAVIEIAPLIEAHRQPSSEIFAFSYRFHPDDKGGLFRSDRSFRHWMNAQIEYVRGNLKVKSIVTADISDFYARINFHRLENLLDEVASKHGAARYVVKQIKIIRAKQSFGVPVGGSAARILAELTLADTDLALVQDGRRSTRFVDDFRIFLYSNEQPYDLLASLAEQIGLNEGLSLNNSKTRVETRTDFLDRLKGLTADVADEAEGAALDALTSELYLDEEPDPEQLAKLKNINLLDYLQEEVGKEVFDMGRIKVLFRALKIVKPIEAIDYLIENLSELVVFSKDVVLLMEALEGKQRGCFNELTDVVVTAILSPPAVSVQLVKTWLLELFVRGVVPIDMVSIRRLETLASPLDRRQLHLIRGRFEDKLFFRRGKTSFGSLSAMEQACFAWGASCLPKDEFETWLTTARTMFSRPTGALFLKWVQRQRGHLTGKLELSTDDHQE